MQKKTQENFKVTPKLDDILRESPCTFIAHPNADRADDGVVCSICYDSERHASFLLILDGKTFWPIAKAFVKHHIPASLHGAFYSSDKINGF